MYNKRHPCGASPPLVRPTTQSLKQHPHVHRPTNRPTTHKTTQYPHKTHTHTDIPRRRPAWGCAGRRRCGGGRSTRPASRPAPPPTAAPAPPALVGLGLDGWMGWGGVGLMVTVTGWIGNAQSTIHWIDRSYRRTKQRHQDATHRPAPASAAPPSSPRARARARPAAAAPAPAARSPACAGAGWPSLSVGVGGECLVECERV